MTTTSKPTWADYWATVGNEDWLAARALCEISARVRNEVEMFLRYREVNVYRAGDDEPSGTRPEPDLDWEDFAAHVEHEAVMSSTEHRLASLVAALTSSDHRVDLVHTLGQMGSWEVEVWRILTEWATGGRATVVPR